MGVFGRGAGRGWQRGVGLAVDEAHVGGANRRGVLAVGDVGGAGGGDGEGGRLDVEGAGHVVDVVVGVRRPRTGGGVGTHGVALGVVGHAAGLGGQRRVVLAVDEAHVGGAHRRGVVAVGDVGGAGGGDGEGG